MQRGLSICSCMHSLKGEEDFSSFSPALTQRRGGLLLFLACTRSRVRRTSSLASRRTRALRAFYITGAFDRRKTMRSLKLLTIAADRRKTMGTLKLLTIAANRRKTMGTLKPLTIAADRRKTMGTLKLLLESMQYNFTVALDHVQVTRSFF